MQDESNPNSSDNSDHCASPRVNQRLLDACKSGDFDGAVDACIQGEYGDDACIKAAFKGEHFDILELLLNHTKADDPPISVDVCSLATHLNKLSLLEWLHRGGFPLTEKTFANAAEHGNMEMLTYLQQHDCPKNDTVMIKAIAHGHFKIAPILFAWGCPPSPRLGYIAIGSKYHNAPETEILRMVIWLYDKGIVTPDMDRELFGGSFVCLAAVMSYVSIVHWAVGVGFDVDINDLHIRLRRSLPMNQREYAAKNPIEWARQRAMCSYVADVLELYLASLGKPQKYNQRKIEAPFTISIKRPQPADE